MDNSTSPEADAAQKKFDADVETVEKILDAIPSNIDPDAEVFACLSRAAKISAAMRSSNGDFALMAMDALDYANEIQAEVDKEDDPSSP